MTRSITAPRRTGGLYIASWIATFTGAEPSMDAAVADARRRGREPACAEDAAVWACRDLPNGSLDERLAYALRCGRGHLNPTLVRSELKRIMREWDCCEECG
jgi:hypothetical protein